MTEIISMSMDEKTLKELETLQGDLGLSGRSETIRQCIRLFSNEKKQSKKMTGEIDGVILAVHPDEYTETVSQTRHAHQSIIKTQIHHHLDSHACLELFIVKGNADHVKRLMGDLQANKRITFSKLLVV
jgi:CopG family nickel-responsive transcriptional regulator